MGTLMKTDIDNLYNQIKTEYGREKGYTVSKKGQYVILSYQGSSIIFTLVEDKPDRIHMSVNMNYPLHKNVDSLHVKIDGHYLSQDTMKQHIEAVIELFKGLE